MECFIYQSVNFAINSVLDFESMQRIGNRLIWQNLDVLPKIRANEFCTRCNCFMYLSSIFKKRELQ